MVHFHGGIFAVSDLVISHLLFDLFISHVTDVVQLAIMAPPDELKITSDNFLC